MFADFEEHLGYAIEELERTINLLEVAKLLADGDAVPDLTDSDRRRHMALVIQQGIWANDCALDFFRLLPEQLRK